MPGSASLFHRPGARIAWLGGGGGRNKFWGGHEKFIYVNSRGARGHEKFNKVKTKKRSEFQRDFLAKFRNSNGFSGRKQVISKKQKKKKGLHPKNFMKSGVSPQKLRKYRWIASISVNFFGAHSSLGRAQISFGGGHKQSFEGAQPRNSPPWRRVCSSTCMLYYNLITQF